MTGREEPWHLDKRVPVALIATLFLQFGAGVWWASGTDRDLQQIKADIARQDRLIEAARETAGLQAIQLGRIEENTRATQEAVERLLRQMEAGR